MNSYSSNNNGPTKCVFCDIPSHGAMDGQFKPLKLRCGHYIHKCCLGNLF